MTQIATPPKAGAAARAGRFFDQHRETLERALRAIRERAYWSPYPEVPSGSIYGETANAALTAALPAWRAAGAEARAGVCLEILDRLNKRSFEMGYAVMHTTGQPFVMAFQAGGPHAQDRGLEAVAYAWSEMTRHADHVTWEKPQGKRDPIRLAKSYRVVPRGLALVI